MIRQKVDYAKDYTVEMLQAAGHAPYYLKNKDGKKCPDFLLEELDQKIVIEVGWSRKRY